ncbi:AtpZ/AtpI family protein [Anaerostipes sp.]|uniref:AtpZ/AtpI family protein n=1 Tax=Anaerostipes sp. TaxID=1872530 RepID=UPI0025C6697D|nr:AtpZ/AtpI family protein [Anaerostipes sp.]MBS7006889.1 AtpZ/AtpI family protein [Anaerostipes sp.]
MKINRDIVRSLSLITQLGITILTSVFLCMFLGLWLDRKFSTHFFIPFLILGVGGGLSGAWKLIRNVSQDEEDNDDKRD